MRDQRSRQHINPPPQRKGKSMQHAYTSHITWTGNQGTGTSGYKAYARTWDIAVKGKEPIHCSNDPLLGGDPGKMNPEDLLLSSLSACHMLWYLHLASDAGITVMEYQDSPVATGEVLKGGRGSLYFCHPQAENHRTTRNRSRRRHGHSSADPSRLFYRPFGQFPGQLPA